MLLPRYVLHQAIREEDMLLDTRPWGNYLTDYRRWEPHGMVMVFIKIWGKLAMPKIKFGL